MLHHPIIATRARDGGCARASRPARVTQGIVTPRHKFARFFAATSHQLPTTWKDIFEVTRHDTP